MQPCYCLPNKCAHALIQVFEFMQTDLEIVIKDRSLTLSPADVKSYMQMVLKGIGFCHKRWILHRDIKPNNFLISATGVLSRTANPSKACSMSLLSSELQLGSQVYQVWTAVVSIASICSSTHRGLSLPLQTTSHTSM